MSVSTTASPILATSIIRYNVAMRQLGRGCQMLALAGLPLSIPLQLMNVIDLRQMLALMGASLCLFYIGRLLEGYAGAP